MLDFYKNIKRRRLELGITQTELADRTGYADKSMIAKIEKGQINLPQSKIILFADALSTTPGSLIDIISRRLGHSSSAITARVYFHVTANLKKTDSDRIKGVKLM